VKEIYVRGVFHKSKNENNFKGVMQIVIAIENLL